MIFHCLLTLYKVFGILCEICIFILLSIVHFFDQIGVCFTIGSNTLSHKKASILSCSSDDLILGWCIFHHGPDVLLFRHCFVLGSVIVRYIKQPVLVLLINTFLSDSQGCLCISDFILL